ncbi:class I SAM-dependent methyltransferase [Humisphaera borealis]|uniref:Class I SAM-dependent methyltransferase n=1 Tax=Humisphaera borealis TaxID=2807512 RepID=A0A7M2WS78_9BACT|nr:class I SAM-dependent methyltransferase [Humisphaera borealis]QOV88385.1 class I SAM-dependent methyltransferase [Humisphaera borealis]
MDIDLLAYNRDAWDRRVAGQNQWTVPVSAGEIAEARSGNWQIVLTPTKPVPRDWFPPLAGARVLGLAAGGGQQGPILAAAGAEVTVFDLSPAQLAQDDLVARRDGLALRTVQGDMADLSCFADGSFDLIVHPCSNCFVPDILPVWREAYRVLRPGGTLLAGFTYPIAFVFDPELEQAGVFQIKYAMPYSDLTLTEQERKRYTDAGDPLAFGHSLGDQLGGQIAAGLAITGFYEDRWNPQTHAIARWMDCFGATRAQKANPR